MWYKKKDYVKMSEESQGLSEKEYRRKLKAEGWSRRDINENIHFITYEVIQREHLLQPGFFRKYILHKIILRNHDLYDWYFPEHYPGK